MRVFYLNVIETHATQLISGYINMNHMNNQYTL